MATALAQVADFDEGVGMAGRKKRKNHKHLKRFARAVFFLALSGMLFLIISNVLIVRAGQKQIASDAELKELDAECILVLGAGVWRNKQPSPLLRDRLDEGLRLYEEGVAPKILVSGDHGQADYDEVNVMKKYLMDAGVPSEDIFMDHAGFSTYESMYRANYIFGVKKLVVVTQQYHLHRALYICRGLGLEALGAKADKIEYAGQNYRNMREWLARDKDIFTTLFKVKPTYLGEKIDIHGDGNVTND